MSSKKRRLTITIDPHLVDAAEQAIESGDAESVSGWVSAAIEDKVRRDRKLHRLRAAIADYEQEYGEITEEEIEARRRADRHDATVVRGDRLSPPSASSA
jgi:Arc/MetJ-type ribon-helix-helix transcriptional regulator